MQYSLFDEAELVARQPEVAQSADLECAAATHQHQYLLTLFEKLPHAHSTEELDELLPQMPAK